MRCNYRKCKYIKFHFKNLFHLTTKKREKVIQCNLLHLFDFFLFYTLAREQAIYVLDNDLKGVFAKNERGYRLTAKNNRF